MVAFNYYRYLASLGYPLARACLFHMDAELDVPPSLSLEKLRESLQLIGDQLGVDIEVAPAQNRP